MSVSNRLSYIQLASPACVDTQLSRHRLLFGHPTTGSSDHSEGNISPCSLCAFDQGTYLTVTVLVCSAQYLLSSTQTSAAVLAPTAVAHTAGTSYITEIGTVAHASSPSLYTLSEQLASMSKERKEKLQCWAS